MSQFPWTQVVVESEEDRKAKKKETKNQDKEKTGLRYVPWLFKDSK